MSAPVLFLDIDGVLNHSGTKERLNGFTGIDAGNVAQLNGIVEAVPDLRIVISSTWRQMMTLGDIKRALLGQGFRFPRQVVSKTPEYLRTTTGGITVARERGHEVQAWLDEEKDPPRAIAILDDAEDMVHLTPRLVRTDLWNGGLTAEHARAVVALLKEPAP